MGALTSLTKLHLVDGLGSQAAGDEIESQLGIGPDVPGDTWYVDGLNGTNTADGKTWSSAVKTITYAHDTLASAGDVIKIAGGAAYDETVNITKARMVLIGVGTRGLPFINPTTAAASGMKITADSVTIVNLGIAGESTATSALEIEGAQEVRLRRCKIEGNSGATIVLLLLGGTASSQVGNLMIDDCEFAFGGTGIRFDNSGYGFPTQVRIKESHFHETTVACMAILAGTGGVRDLWVLDSLFANSEDATEPTDFILVNRVGDTGYFGGNHFANPTNDTAQITIAAGIIWGPNGTEAGWSTARPA